MTVKSNGRFCLQRKARTKSRFICQPLSEIWTFCTFLVPHEPRDGFTITVKRFPKTSKHETKSLPRGDLVIGPLSNRNHRLFTFYIQSFSLTECIVVVRVRKMGGCLSVCVCVCLCVCVSVCLWRAVWRNYWADFNQTYPNGSPNGLVVRVCDLAH